MARCLSSSSRLQYLSDNDETLLINDNGIKYEKGTYCFICATSAVYGKPWKVWVFNNIIQG